MPLVVARVFAADNGVEAVAFKAQRVQVVHHPVRGAVGDGEIRDAGELLDRVAKRLDALEHLKFDPELAGAGAGGEL